MEVLALSRSFDNNLREQLFATGTKAKVRKEGTVLQQRPIVDVDCCDNMLNDVLWNPKRLNRKLSSSHSDIKVVER